MLPEAALRMLREMVEIPSVSGQERKLAEYLAAEMAKLGFDSRVDAVGNAVGEIGPAAGPRILLLGHLDTVPGEIPVRQEGRLLYGRGAVDAKGPLAAFVAAAARLASTVRLTVAGVVEEETYGSRGARHLLMGPTPAAVLIGEPSGWANVVLGYKGQIGISFRVASTPRHEASGERNAAASAIDFFNRLEEYLGRQSAGEGVFHRAQAFVRRTVGDAEAASLDLSCRLPPRFDFDALDRFCHSIGGEGTVSFQGATPAVLVERTSPTVRALVQAIRRAGGKPGLRVKTGTSDMNTVSEQWQMPMAAYGPGDSSLDHTPHEHLDLDEYLRSIDVLTTALPLLAAELAAASAHPDRS